MTRFVYVLPAGRLRWEVRWDVDPLRDAIRRAKGLMSQYYDADVPHEVIELIQDLRVILELPATEQVLHGEHHPIGSKCRRPNCDELHDPAPPLFYRRKSHALIAARAIAIVIGGEVQPHNRWGRIQDPDSYGNDPRESKG